MHVESDVKTFSFLPSFSYGDRPNGDKGIELINYSVFVRSLGVCFDDVVITQPGLYSALPFHCRVFCHLTLYLTTEI